MQVVKEVLHGIEVTDEYRWLEGSDAPEISEPDPTLDARVSRWTNEQNKRTRSVLDSLPGRQSLEERLRQLLEVGQVASPMVRKDRYFFWRRQGGQPQWSIEFRQGPHGEGRVLLDPNALDPKGHTALGSFMPNQDGTLAAFTLFEAGDENTTLYLLEVDSGNWLSDEIPGKVEGIYWLPDSSGFLYHCLADVDDPYSREIRMHRVGYHHRWDVVLVEQDKEGPLATTWGPFASLSEDARWLLLGYWTGTDSNDVWVVDFQRWQQTGEFERQEIIVGEAVVSSGLFSGNTLFLKTSLNAPNSRVLAVDLLDPRPEAWLEVVPERPGAIVENVSLAKEILAVRLLENAASRILLYHFDGTLRGELELPGVGSASLSTSMDRCEAFLTFESFDLPPTIYLVDLDSGDRKLLARPEIPLGELSFEVRQVWFPSKDGVDISMFLVHRKGLELNGKVPTLLGGYGGFGISLTPSFDVRMLPWLEAGGIWAIANLRGGGEYGQSWHAAGMLGRKQNVFDDFISAAEWLIQNGYTSSSHLGIRGGSNGGLLTGAALVQRPELFAGVLAAVPLLDMVRYQHFLMARYWVPEYGTSENEEQFRYLLQYSPYHNVKTGIRYPAVLLTAGENDVRVHPLHARKMAARLQASSVSDPEQDPVLLWVDSVAGHGRGKPLAAQIQSVADELGFMMWQLGVPSPSRSHPRTGGPGAESASGRIEAAY
ncbi:MAG: prolyl oligopeptidase family serine peptidase [Deltaproteobacteria bacterium]|nr:prolyl oligopeptidase family serine peptidase [Deltaproteobacteria bacterium]